jgi:hypothetical protein
LHVSTLGLNPTRSAFCQHTCLDLLPLARLCLILVLATKQHGRDPRATYSMITQRKKERKERKKRKKERSLARVDELRLIQLWWVRLKKGRVHDLDVSSEHNLLLAVTVRGAVCLHISVHHEADE